VDGCKVRANALGYEGKGEQENYFAEYLLDLGG
jgi:hypothetical protein